MGRDVGEALALSDPKPIGVVQEWGVRQLGLQLELSTRAAIRKPVTVDLFPAYDEDGGLARGVDAADTAAAGSGRPLQPRRSRARRDPELTRDRKHVALLAVQHRRGIHLAPVGVERPGGDDAALALVRQPVDPSGHPGQQRVAAAVSMKRVGARAVDHGPDDLGSDLPRDPGRRDEPSSRPGTRPAWISSPSPSGRVPQTKHSSKTGAPRPASARAAAAASSKSEAEVETRRVAGPCLGDERLAVEQQHPLAVTRRRSRGRSSGGGSRRVTSMPSRVVEAAARARPRQAVRSRSRRWPRCGARESGGRS